MNILHSKQSEGEAEEKSVLNWMPEEDEILEGQLAIDVYQKDDRIIIKSTIAGVKPEDLSITLHNDLLTIKGARFAEQEIKEEDYLYRECYWGNFSRSIILPAEVEQKEIKASLENGVLTISLKKAGEPVKIKVEEDNE
jgi:HSP20 family protein